MRGRSPAIRSCLLSLFILALIKAFHCPNHKIFFDFKELVVHQSGNNCGAARFSLPAENRSLTSFANPKTWLLHQAKVSIKHRNIKMQSCLRLREITSSQTELSVLS
jgi:hypothetical protein